MKIKKPSKETIKDILMITGLSIVFGGGSAYLNQRAGAINCQEKTIYFYKKDLNKNGIPEQFYEIEGQKYFSKIDGKNVEDLLEWQPKKI